jgi:DNA-binding transcriptional LysR family regulator
MNIAQLRTFLTVVERGSFSEAARTLGISQPAVTMQIQALEADVGATLLDRRYRRVDLTEAGNTLMPYARKVMAELDDARAEIGALSGTVTGHLTIAASTTPGVYVIPRLLGSYLAANPQVRVTITVQDTADVVAAIESGRADVGVTGAMIKGSRVSYQELGADELVVICPVGDELAGWNNVPFAHLAEADWVMREMGSGTRQVADLALADHGIDPQELRVVVELGTGEAIVSAVEGGLGVGMLSRFVAEKALSLGTVARVDLEGDPILRPFYSVLPKGSTTRAAEAFCAHLRSQITG